MEADNEIINSININLNEVKDIKFVPISDLNSQNQLTPWMEKIIKSNLLMEWIKDFKESKARDDINNNCEFIKTRYSTEPIRRL